MTSRSSSPLCLLCTVPRSGSHHLIAELALAVQTGGDVEQAV